MPESFERERRAEKKWIETVEADVKEINAPEIEDRRSAERLASEKELGAVRERIASSEEIQSAPTNPNLRADLYGEFESEKGADGVIRLSGEAKASAETLAAKFRKEAKFMTNTVTGEPIAAEYDIRTNNFSTQTRIAELEDGRKVFAVYDHKGSAVHRFLDGLMKKLSGLRMAKVSRAEWKRAFEEKSTIPTIENDDPDTVLMPFIPNVNGSDLFERNREIKDFGVCHWATGAGAEEKLSLAEELVDEAKRRHDVGTPWGELILPNVIYSEDKKPIICDPEVRYDPGVTLEEAKARDLKDLCVSVAGALERAHGADVGKTVARLLSRYGDRDTVIALQELAGKKRGLVANLTFGYEQARTGVSGKKQYDKILAAIREYNSDRLMAK